MLVSLCEVFNIYDEKMATNAPHGAPETSRTTFVGTGWKMNKTIAEAREFIDELNAAPAWDPRLQVFIIPPYTVIGTVREALDPAAGVWVGAQNAHWMESGAYTGEISMDMIKDAGAELVEIGHSERREHFNETDESVNLKIRAALRADLVPLLCVGEGRDVRDSGRAVEFVTAQVEAALAGVDEPDRAKVLVAYEPIWSIGDEGTPASPQDIAEVAGAIRSGFAVRGVLYGGSVSAANAREVLQLPEVDGLFVGRSGWTAEGLLEILRLAGTSA